MCSADWPTTKQILLEMEALFNREEDVANVMDVIKVRVCFVDSESDVLMERCADAQGDRAILHKFARRQPRCCQT